MELPQTTSGPTCGNCRESAQRTDGIQICRLRILANAEWPVVNPEWHGCSQWVSRKTPPSKIIVDPELIDMDLNDFFSSVDAPSRVRKIPKELFLQAQRYSGIGFDKKPWPNNPKICDLLRLSEEDIICLRDIGETTLESLKSLLASHGLKLSSSPLR